ncbi:MAG: ABC transporter permease [Gaiella sp.]
MTPRGPVLASLAWSLLPVGAGLTAGAVLLAALGRNPAAFYADVVRGGIELSAWQDSLARLATLTLIGLGLIVVFRAGLWNLGYHGQFLIAAAIVAGTGPALADRLPVGLTLVLLCLVGAAAGAAWTVIPSVLRATFGTNEIVTTLMMSFVGVNLANLLIRGPFQDEGSATPQTRLLPLDDMLPELPGVGVHAGLVVAAVAVLAAQLVLSRTGYGLRLRVLGLNPAAAAHLGLEPRRLIVTSFLASGALIGAAAAVEILGVWGYMRTDWSPSYGDAVIPFVFLARLRPVALVPFLAFYAVLSIGGLRATQEASLPVDFLLVVVGVTLVSMAVIELIARRRHGRSEYTVDPLFAPLHERPVGT